MIDLIRQILDVENAVNSVNDGDACRLCMIVFK